MEFIVGRDNNVQIRITDISVSRNHSVLTYHNEEFYLKDTSSKFGTLVLMQAPFPIPYKLKWEITMQIGKYLSE
jgi:predicted component of type VI protein secretion system